MDGALASALISLGFVIQCSLMEAGWLGICYCFCFEGFFKLGLGIGVLLLARGDLMLIHYSCVSRELVGDIAHNILIPFQ